MMKATDEAVPGTTTTPSVDVTVTDDTNCPAAAAANASTVGEDDLVTIHSTTTPPASLLVGHFPADLFHELRLFIIR